MTEIRKGWGLGLGLITGVVLTALGLSTTACTTVETAEATEGIPPEAVVDYIYTVISSDREVYAERVVQRLQNEEGVIQADEHFEEQKALPLPAQMLRMGAQLASESGKFRYALISKWAINKANLPKTDIESEGLEAITANPDQPYSGYQTVGDQRYFIAVYPDMAVSQACVQCHNEHPESPKTDFELGGVMGGIVISLPLD